MPESDDSASGPVYKQDRRNSDHDSARENDKENGFSFEFKEKATVGNQKYRASDTYLELGMPYGFNLNLDASGYRSNTSSMTPTFTFGTGEDWNGVSVSATYAITTLANDFKSNAVDVGVSAHNDSKDFTTTVGADVNVTHDSAFIRLPKITNRLDITQRTPTVSLKQQVYKTKVTLDLSQTHYNKNVQAIAALINRIDNQRRFARVSGAYGALNGVITGFPEWTDKIGLYQDMDPLPATLWGNYEGVHMVDTVLASGATADSYMIGADVNFVKVCTATLQYTYIRQTGQGPTDQYELALDLRF